MTKSEMARALANSRKPEQRKGGRPKVPNVCPQCGGEFGSREIRGHVAKCKASDGLVVVKCKWEGKDK